MKFRCPRCKKIFERDMRTIVAKNGMSKKGYRSLCSALDGEYKIVYCKKIDNGHAVEGED